MTSAQTALLSLPGPAEAIVGQRVQVQVEGPPVPKERAWRLVGDTDWLNRVAGNGAVLSMELEAQRDGLSVIKGLLRGPWACASPLKRSGPPGCGGSPFARFGPYTVRSSSVRTTKRASCPTATRCGLASPSP